MSARIELTVSSVLRASVDEVWAHASSLRGVNRELFPLARMTGPRGSLRFSAGAVPLGRRAFRGWILLFGVLPVDYDDVTFVDLPEGGGFTEQSVMLSQREWRHQRVIEAVPGGCRVTDRARFVPRVGALAPVYAAVFRMAFRLRHRNLRRLFGGASESG